MVRSLTALGLALAAGMLLLGAALLFDLRQEAWRRAEQASNNLVLTLERDIERNLTSYDLSVQGTIEALGETGLDDVSPQIRQSALFDRAATAEYLASLLVIDPGGKVVYDSTSVIPHRLDFRDRDYFTAHRDSRDVGLFVSKPFLSRMRNNDPTIAISRRISGRNGDFGGVVVGGIRLAYFEALFSTLDLGRQGAVTLSRTEGQIVVRQPALTVAERDLSQSELVRHSMQEPSGYFVTVSKLDGVRRLVTYRRIGSYPLTVTVALAVDDIFRDWWHKAISIGSILLCLSAATITLCVLFRLEMQRRLATEDKLWLANERLLVMAATDGLTGLANRRAFEADLAQEWRRAVRNETSLGLLVLDVDWFKPFNDMYGHQEGDEALRKIAGCMQRLIRRPADKAARYGGEEFVVLLPDTDLSGAVHTAERICNGLAEMELQHRGSPLGRVTVSIGVAVLRPQHGGDASELVRQADGALYEAKRSGRGRVCVGEATLDEANAAVPLSVMV